MSIISLRGISFKYFGQRDYAIQDINLDVLRGEIIALLGGDNAGKSTLCRTLNGLIPNAIRGEYAGELLLENRDIKSMTAIEISRKVALCFQDPDTQLFNATVEEEVAFGPENLGLEVEEISRRVDRSIEIMGLSDMRVKPPSALSGGQKQRLAIASVLAMLPDVLVLDEPLSMLDPRGRNQLLETIRKLRSEQGISVLVAEKEAEEIMPFCDRVVILKEGRIIAQGNPRAIPKLADLLTYAGVEPPQLLQLLEAMIRKGLIDESARFFDDSTAVETIRSLIGEG